VNVQIGMKFPQIDHSLAGFYFSGLLGAGRLFDPACKSAPKLAQVEHFCQIIPQQDNSLSE
jgi:hypothetical protein